MFFLDDFKLVYLHNQLTRQFVQQFGTNTSRHATVFLMWRVISSPACDADVVFRARRVIYHKDDKASKLLF